MTNRFEDFLTIIIEGTNSEPKKLDKEFVVKINDRGTKYIDALVELIEDYKPVLGKVAKKIKFGTYISFEKNQVSVLTDSNELDELEDLNVYKLVENFSKVEKLVKNFFNNVYQEKKTTSCDSCPLKPICDALDILEEIQALPKKRVNNIILDGEYITVEEKVSIFTNHVKIGYEQFKIRENRFTGTKYVTIEGLKFYVKRDWYGNKYLQLVK